MSDKSNSPKGKYEPTRYPAHASYKDAVRRLLEEVKKKQLAETEEGRQEITETRHTAPAT